MNYYERPPTRAKRRQLSPRRSRASQPTLRPLPKRAFLEEKEVRHGLHVLPAPQLLAAQLQLHPARDLSRVPSVRAALHLRPEGPSTRLCPAEATSEGN